MTDISGVKDRLIRARSARGWSQQTLADKSGVAAAQISRYESGRSAPRPEVIARLARAIGISFEWLLEGTEDGSLEVLADPLEGDRTRGHALRMLLPSEMVKRLEAAAQNGKRSLVAEVRERLEHSLDGRPQQVELKLIGNIRRIKRNGEIEEISLEDLAQEMAGQMVNNRKKTVVSQVQPSPKTRGKQLTRVGR